MRWCACPSLFGCSESANVPLALLAAGKVCVCRVPGPEGGAAQHKCAAGRGAMEGPQAEGAEVVPAAVLRAHGPLHGAVVTCWRTALPAGPQPLVILQGVGSLW